MQHFYSHKYKKWFFNYCPKLVLWPSVEGSLVLLYGPLMKILP